METLSARQAETLARLNNQVRACLRGEPRQPTPLSLLLRREVRTINVERTVMQLGSQALLAV